MYWIVKSLFLERKQTMETTNKRNYLTHRNARLLENWIEEHWSELIEAKHTFVSLAEELNRSGVVGSVCGFTPGNINGAVKAIGRTPWPGARARRQAQAISERLTSLSAGLNPAEPAKK